jgi:hypothetical protein
VGASLIVEELPGLIQRKAAILGAPQNRQPREDAVVVPALAARANRRRQ